MIVTKAVGLVDTTETEDANGAFEVVLSAATLDRDGEVIDSRAFDPLPDHIPFDIDHDMTVTKTVGSGKPFYAEDGSLRVKGTFASTALAQEVRSLVSEGHIRTTSVTFMAADREKDAKGVTHVKTAELLNGTFTPVPSNREAVVLSSKAFAAVTDEKAGARNSATDQQNIQAAHDALVSLGAICGAEADESMLGKSFIPDGMKSIIGSLEAQRDRVRDALEDAYPMRWAYIRGVLPDTVVFDVWGDEDCETWQQTYTDDGSVVTLTGTPVEVDVMEVVMPDADAATEPKSVTTDTDQKSADEAVESAAVKAADSTAKSAVEGSEKSARDALALIEVDLITEMGLGD
jgi:HK97 family phage prohead protease